MSSSISFMMTASISRIARWAGSTIARGMSPTSTGGVSEDESGSDLFFDVVPARAIRWFAYSLEQGKDPQSAHPILWPVLQWATANEARSQWRWDWRPVLCTKNFNQVGDNKQNRAWLIYWSMRIPSSHSLRIWHSPAGSDGAHFLTNSKRDFCNQWKGRKLEQVQTPLCPTGESLKC